MKKNVLTILFLAFCTAFLVLSLRGIRGNPTSNDLNNDYWKDEGPLELSPDRGRFALTYSILEDRSVHFSLPVAKFATPDLGYKNGNYVSLFAPGVSYLIIPGYIIGKYFGISQVGAFAIISLFALVNVFLIREIAKKLGTGEMAATIASLVSLFATPAFTYAVSLYQHHISTFLILASIYILLRWNNLWSLSFIWLFVTASITVDYPNLFLMFPIGVAALGRIIFTKQKEGLIKINVRSLGFVTFFVVIIPLVFFLWFNQKSYGNPFQFSGTVAAVKAIDKEGKPTAPEETGTQSLERFLEPEKRQKSAVRFFKTRNLLNGFYIHFFSADRGMILFTPVMFLSIFGIILAYRERLRMITLLLAVVGVNVLLYSMWGDPYGGWAFGSRYLIPFYAIMSIFIAIALSHQRKNILFLIFFFLVLSYSVAVNTLGAITSSRNPPKVEAIPLERLSGVREEYTYARNIDYLKNNRSKSFVFQTFAFKYLTALQYYWILTGSVILFNMAILLSLVYSKKDNA